MHQMIVLPILRIHNTHYLSQLLKSSELSSLHKKGGTPTVEGKDDSAGNAQTTGLPEQHNHFDSED